MRGVQGLAPGSWGAPSAPGVEGEAAAGLGQGLGGAEGRRDWVSGGRRPCQRDGHLLGFPETERKLFAKGACSLLCLAPAEIFWELFCSW